uniref:NADH-ubiquinone oxidoreductase chain 1 n=1 Tax=Pseudotrapelus sinaitus TaxID=118229 RepID=D1MV74_9SAUR|nr:NADH dehydrogenase subunit 1 [Pseudotrapelus sinaitus]BAI52988.1 NADH dehydrogenase subunit 1 [Pseudotrapelus sinaitus]
MNWLTMTNILLSSASILASVAFFTFLERKMMSASQQRKGPNKTGPQGILQPIADGLKLFMKEPLHPTLSSKTMFTISPLVALTLAMLLWTPMPMPTPMMNMNLGLIFIMAASSIGVFTILWSGWASNSKYSVMGSLRAVAQSISYEVTVGLILMCLATQAGGYTMQLFSITQEQTWLVMPVWPLAMMWFISTMAETNRSPFDLTEGESELVSGFNVEYASGMFAMFFLPEYSNILMMNTLSAILFFSSACEQHTSTLSLMMKTMALTGCFIWIRTAYPRFRYDQLMHLLWKQFLPMTIAACLLFTLLPLSIASIPPV